MKEAKLTFSKGEGTGQSPVNQKTTHGKGPIAFLTYSLPWSDVVAIASYVLTFFLHVSDIYP